MKPENDPNQPESYEIDLDQIRVAREIMADKMSKAPHNWRQEGMLVSCTSCPFGHGFGISPGMVLTGVEDGKPVFKNIFEQS
jgi:hypothetical protein